MDIMGCLIEISAPCFHCEGAGCKDCKETGKAPMKLTLGTILEEMVDRLDERYCIKKDGK